MLLSRRYVGSPTPAIPSHQNKHRPACPVTLQTGRPCQTSRPVWRTRTLLGVLERALLSTPLPRRPTFR